MLGLDVNVVFESAPATSLETEPSSVPANMSGAIQATATAADQHQVEQVTVSIIPVVKQVARGETKDDLEVLVRVQAPTTATKRAPIDLVAVLDVSTSMTLLPDSKTTATAGKKSRLDLLKDAMKFVVSKLHGGDRLATVAFNDKVVDTYTSELKEIPASLREAELKRVDDIKASGDTYFRPALQRAVGMLDKVKDEPRRGFILFLSDGYEYPTKTTADPMFEKYPIHAFGFSKFHDPKAMHDIAKRSRGTYSFLNEGLDNIKQAFGFCLGALQTVVAAELHINLTVKYRDVEITSIDSGGYPHSRNTDGKSGNITIPVLYAGEVKEFIVHLKVPPCDGSKEPLFSIDGKCDTWGKQGRVRADAQIPDGDLHIERPEAVAKDQQLLNEKVVEQVNRFKVLKMLSDFVTNMKSVDMKVKKDTAVNSLSGSWEKLKKDCSSIVDRYEGPVQEMLANLGDGDGGAFVYAWKSGTEMQCVTTMGSPANVAEEYMTPAIQNMRKEAQKPLADIIAAPPPPPPEEEIIAALPPPPPAEEGPADVTKPAVAPEYRPWPCACLEFNMIGQHLTYWAVVKRDLLRLVQQVEGNGGHHHLTGTFHDLELASINRAMYESVFLAVEHGHNLRASYCAATGKPHLAACYDGEER